MKTIVCAAIVLGFVGATANAQILINDDFNRPDGDLVGTAPTPGPGGVWANHSGSGSFIQISSGQAVVSHGGGSREDANSTFELKGSGVLTAAFDIIVNATNAITGGDYEYFAHFFQTGDFNFRSRLDVVEPTGSGDYTLGISSGTSTAEAVFPTDFNFGDTVSLELGFDFDSGIGSLTVGGTTVLGTGVFLSDALDAFALRQSTSSANETILVDNLVVSYVPEPTSLALGGFGLLALMMARRRR